MDDKLLVRARTAVETATTIRASKRRKGETPGSPTITDFPGKSSIASQQSTATETVDADTTETVTDYDIEIERENSAWDALGERFQHAATQGRYLDLTNDEEESAQQLSADNAQVDFRTVPAPVDPRIIVQLEGQVSAMQEGCQDPQLQELWNLIAASIEALKEARGVLTEADISVAVGEEILRPKLKDINKSVRRIQAFVKKNANVVAERSIARRRIEELNLLVHKANIFITQYNNKMYKEESLITCKCGLECHSIAALNRHISAKVRTGEKRTNHGRINY